MRPGKLSDHQFRKAYPSSWTTVVKSPKNRHVWAGTDKLMATARMPTGSHRGTFGGAGAVNPEPTHAGCAGSGKAMEIVNSPNTSVDGPRRASPLPRSGTVPSETSRPRRRKPCPDGRKRSPIFLTGAHHYSVWARRGAHGARQSVIVDLTADRRGALTGLGGSAEKGEVMLELVSRE